MQPPESGREPGGEWRGWMKHFQDFPEATEVAEKPGRLKTSTLLHWAGPEALETYRNSSGRMKCTANCYTVIQGCQECHDSGKNVTGKGMLS